MKKTLFALALMAAFGSAATATEPPTWDFSTTIYGTQKAEGFYKGISFSLATDSDRYTADAPLYQEDFEATLVSIQIQSRYADGSGLPESVALLVVDSEGTMLGLATSNTHHNAQLNGFQYTRPVSTFAFGEGVKLNTSETYAAYFVDGEVASTLPSDFVLTAANFDTTVNSSGMGLMLHNGATYTDSAANWGVLNGLGTTTSTGYVPNVKITLKAPEPATATLSLLALAGLAARRKRH